MLHQRSCALDRDQPQRDLANNSRQPHAADGRPKESGILTGGAARAGSVGEDHLDRLHVRAERAAAMMILAMHVRGDAAAERYVLGARRDRREPAARNGDVENVLQSHAGLGAQHAARRIELEYPVEPLAQDHASVRIERGIAIAAALPANDYTLRGRCQFGIAFRAYQFA